MIAENKTVKNSSGSDNIIYFVVSSIFLMLAASITYGYFVNINQLFFVFLAFLALLCPLINLRILDKLQAIIPVKKLLLTCATFYVILFYFLDNGIFVPEEITEKINILKLSALALFSLYLVENNSKINLRTNFIAHIIKYKFFYILAAAILIRIATVAYSPAPKLDVFYVTNGMVDNLFSGRNPYSENYFAPQRGAYSNPGYLPMITFMNAPGRLLLGDIRYGYIVAQILCAAILYSLLKNKFQNGRTMIELPVLMFMFLPNSIFILEMAWVEPLLLLILFFFAFVLTKEKMSYLACIILGIFISLKQNNFPFLILALANFRVNLKQISTILLTALLPIAPFLIWNYHSFIYTTATYMLNFKILPQSISLNNLYFMVYKEEIPFYIKLGAISTLIAFLILRSKKNNLVNYLHSSIVCMLFVFFLLWGYTNYYYFISGGLTLLITLGLINNNEIGAKQIYEK